jgi:tight adherence protein B
VNALAALFVGAFFACAVALIVGVPLRFGSLRAGRRTQQAERRRLWLRQAGLRVTPAQFVAGSAGAGLLALVLVRTATGSWFVAAVPAIAVSLLPRAYFGRQRDQRLRRVQAAWPDGLRDLLASIAAGQSLGQAVTALAATGPEPLREAFARYPDLARMVGTGPALEIVKDELADPTSDRVLEVLVLAHERGGGIVRSILEDLVGATTKDLKLLD